MPLYVKMVQDVTDRKIIVKKITFIHFCCLSAILLQICCKKIYKVENKYNFIYNKSTEMNMDYIIQYKLINKS